ncbi:hypothetical protein D5b_00038 [Faustovirus]|nr:hypothetical protein D5b_00038 [Faustovirus]AMN84871.1 hypothetical protein D6_00472 [Faustovirus]AMP43997.1 hypothetical protein PRJ_Dakar_00037 [Faustovirus]
MFQSRFAASIAVATEEERSLQAISKLYSAAATLLDLERCGEGRVAKRSKGSKSRKTPTVNTDITFTNVRPIGVKYVAPVRVIIAKQNNLGIKPGSWIINNDVAFTWEWNAAEGKMVRNVITPTACINTCGSI